MTDAELVERSMRRWMALVEARDVSGLERFVDECYAPDAWIDFGTRTPDSVPGEGVQVIVEWARDAFRQWDQEGVNFRYEFDEVIDTGNGIVVPARSRGVIQGCEMETRFTYLYRVRDGKIAWMTMYATTEEAVAAARADSVD